MNATRIANVLLEYFFINIFRRFVLEIALAIPASNELKIYPFSSKSQTNKCKSNC